MAGNARRTRVGGVRGHVWAPQTKVRRPDCLARYVARRSRAPYLRRWALLIALGAPQARVERVPERVPQEVRAKDREADGEAGEEDEPGRLLRVLGGRHGKHPAPRGIRLGHTDPEKGQRGLDEDRATQLRGAEDDEG